jgi:hypothetical protein
VNSHTLSAHPLALRYLKVQAGVLFFTAFLSVAMVLLVLFFHAYPLSGIDGVWMVSLALVAVALVWGAMFSIGVRVPPLVVGDGELRVGDAAVRLDGTTRIELAQPAALPVPRSTKKAFFRLPGMVGFPHFDGGPKVTVRTGDQAVTFRPLLYGPAAFFGASADPHAAEVVGRLAEGRGGEVASWLRSTFTPPGGIPKIDTRVTVFLVSYIIISAAIVVFLGWLLVYGVARARGAG